MSTRWPTHPEDAEDYLMKVEALILLHINAEGVHPEAIKALKVLYDDIEILNANMDGKPGTVGRRYDETS